MRGWVIIGFIALTGCGGDNTDSFAEDPYNNPVYHLFMDSATDILGFSIGDSMTQNHSAISQSIIEQQDDLIRAEMGFIAQDTSHLALRFKYKAGLLYDIQVRIKTASGWQARKYYSLILDYYNQRYGSNKTGSEYATWTTDTPEPNNTLEISLTNESDLYGFPLITLSYFVRWGY